MINFSILAAALAVLMAGLTFLSPRLAVTMLVAMLPTYLLRFNVVGVPFTLLETIIVVVFATWFLQTAWHARHTLSLNLRATNDKRNPFAPYVWPILFWLLASALAVLVAPNLMMALGLWKAYIVEPLMVLALIVMLFNNSPTRFNIVWALGAVVLGVGASVALQGLGLLPVPEPYASAQILKLTGFFAYPNAVGLLVAPIVAMFMWWWLSRLDRAPVLITLLKTLIVGVGVVSILMAMTKGAMFGLWAAVLAMAVIFTGWRRAVLTLGLIVSLLIVLAAPTAKQLVSEQIFFNSPSGQVRLTVWDETLQMLQHSPILGAGLGGYQTALVPYHVYWRPEITPYKMEIFLYPHNIFLNAWTELGLLGLIAWCWLLWAFFRLTWQQRHLPMSAMALVAMTTLLVHGLVDVPYFKNDLAVLFWIIMAMPLLERRRLHHMHLHPDYYRQMAVGHKTAEVRISDKKRQAVRVGDLIVFYPHQDAYESIQMEVQEVISRATFIDLFEHLSPEEVGFAEIQHALEALSIIYEDGADIRHGAVAFRLKRVG